MAAPAGSLEEVRGENGLFPGQGGFMCFGHLCSWTLAPMADRATPLAHIVRDRRVRAERLRNGSIRQTRLGYALMAGGATVCDVHSRQPHLVNAGSVIGKEFLGVGTGLSVLYEPALVILPLRTKVLEGRNRQREYADDCRQGECKPQFLRQFAHIFSRHGSSRATPRTTLAPKKCAYHRQANGFRNEPSQHPPRERLAAQRMHPPVCGL